MRELVTRLGVEVSEKLLTQAITHRSYSYENGGIPTNERLEFLGDSVLGLVVTDELYRKNPDAEEGQLAKLRAAVDALEAIIGAIYVEHGIEKSGEVILQLFAPIIAASAELGEALDWKTSLTELVAGKNLGPIEYLIEQSGPDHDKSFSAKVKVGDLVFAHGVGKSKKEAEQKAASIAFQDLKQK
ncbi:MAG: hypothetical protein RLZZ183_1011 [Actinomycetota bacterium]